MSRLDLFDVAVVLSDLDDVAVLRIDLPEGAEVSGPAGAFVIRRSIRAGHKVAVREVASGAPIRKYGQIIGFAAADIAPGDHVHVHNVSVRDFAREYEFATECAPLPVLDPAPNFQGFLRNDGRVGTRNYVAIISTVNCSASVSQQIADAFPREELTRYPTVDGLLPLTHKAGCGSDPDGPGLTNLRRVLTGYGRHPNIGACMIVGLGCETNQAALLIDGGLLQIGARRTPPPVLNIQDCGGIAKTVQRGVEVLRQLLPVAAEARRTSQPAAKLILGTECGGSDANSGITANPALGVASDELVRSGGTTVLCEFPEIYGAEHLLTRRCVSRDVGEKLLERIRWWEWYAGVFGASINNNPSHGNKEGGLTTIFEKSLGAIAKGGAAPIRAVYEYAEPIRETGLVLMDTPGYDPVSATGIVAGGANIIVFTTGRGSVFGCKPVPSIKVTTNTAIFQHMNDDMDIDAGRILRGTTVREAGLDIFDAMLRVASGERTKSELHGIGDAEFAPWDIGPQF